MLGCRKISCGCAFKTSTLDIHGGGSPENPLYIDVPPENPYPTVQSFYATGSVPVTWSTPTVIATMAVPDQGVGGSLFIMAHVLFATSVANSDWRFFINDGSFDLAQWWGSDNLGSMVLHDADWPANKVMTAGSGATITIRSERNLGTGTASAFEIDLHGIFVPS